ncbi:hypothetical protein ACWEQG_01920 [Microbispora sp. NPDC004025]
MPYRTFGTEVFTSSDMNTYLMRQALIVCTSGTRPSPVPGMHIWQTDTLTEHVWDGSAWRFTRAADLFALKVADESVTNSTTQQTDDHLFVAVEANATYIAEALLRYVGTTNGALQLGFTVPAGTTFPWASFGAEFGSTNRDSASVRVAAPDQSATIGAAGFGTSAETIWAIKGLCVRTGGTAGTFGIRWAQVISDPGATTVRAGSYLHARRVA